jgi:4-amino-4-deoxy-L-arabinose transferase-like glycosyltransferase
MKNSKVFVFLISFLVFSLTYYFSLSSKTYWWDEAVYLGIARNLATKLYFGINFPFPERLFDFYQYRLVIDESFRQPLFPFLLSFFYWFGESIERFLPSFFASLTILATYILAKKVKNEVVGIIACLFLASSYYFLFFSSKVLTESLAAFLFTISFYFLLLFEKNKKFIIPFSITFSLSVLTRYPNAILVFPFLFLVFIKRDMKSFILFLLIGLVVTLPWIVFNCIRYGSLVGALIVSLSQVVPIFSDSGNKYFYYPPYHYLVNSLEIFGLPIFFSLFFFLNWKKENKLLFFTLILVFLVFSLLPRKEFRYLVPFFPLFYISASIGVFNSIKERRVMYLVVAILFVIGMSISVNFLNYKEDDSLVKAANFIKEKVSEGDFIIGENYPVLNYITKAYVLPFTGSFASLEKILTIFNISYVVVDKEITLPSYAFELENLGFEKVFEFGNVKVFTKRA